MNQTNQQISTRPKYMSIMNTTTQCFDVALELFLGSRRSSPYNCSKLAHGFRIELNRDLIVCVAYVVGQSS